MKKLVFFLLAAVIICLCACSNVNEVKVQEYDDALSLSELGELNRKVLEFDDASVFNKDFVAVKLKGRWGLLDYKKDEFVSPLIYDTITFENGYWVLTNDDGWSTSMNEIRDENGELVFNPKNFDMIVPIDTNLFIEQIIANNDLVEKLVDSKGKELAPSFFDHRYVNKNLVLRTKDNDIIVVQNKNGKIKTRDFGKEYFSIWPSKKQGLYIVCTNDEKEGIVDENGQVVLPIQYDGCSDFFLDELLIVSKDDKMFIINSKGDEIFSTEDELSYFSEGLIKGMDADGNVFFLNEKGELQFKLGANIANVSEFTDGVAVVGTEDSNEETPDGKCGLINMKGEYVIPLNYYQMRQSENRIWLCKSFMGKYGLYDIEGKEILPFEYESIDNFQNGIALVRKGGHSYFINRNGETGIDDISTAIAKGEKAKQDYLDKNRSELYQYYQSTIRGYIYRVLSEKVRNALSSETKITNVEQNENGTYSAKFEFEADEGTYFFKLHGLKFDEKGHFAERPTGDNMEIKFVHDMMHVDHDNEVYSLPFHLPNAEEQMMYYNEKLMQGNRYNPYR